MFWRSIVWFPYAVAKLGVILLGLCAALLPFLATAVGALAFAMMGLWWKAAVCAVGFVACVFLARWLMRRVDPHALHPEFLREGDLRG
jgi:hypothetical protein